MRSFLLTAAAMAASITQIAPVPMLAQIPAQNSAGIGIGHVHFMTADPDALGKMLGTILGATEVNAGSMKMYKIPGLYMMIFKGTPAGGSNGSSVNHIGFAVKDYADVKAKLVAAGAKQVFDLAPQKQMMFDIADGVRMEFFEDAALAAAGPVVHHHMHLSIADPEAGQAWYMKVMAAEKGSRRNLPAAMFPGGEVDFLKANPAQGAAPGTPVVVGTKGRSIDHIGFDVKDLKATMERMKAEGATIESDLRDMTAQIGLKIAFVTDPNGTRIELTEGLAGK
jgi:catechol 2,3-dioxygenase-like lactoylglutathione lyase family enzyme